MLKVLFKMALLIVGLFVLIEILAWSESDKDKAVGFFLPYELYYYADEGKSEAEATKFELQFEPTAALKKAGMNSCSIQVRKDTYQALAEVSSLSGNNDQRYTIVPVYWDKLTRNPRCYDGFDSVKVIEQHKASQYAEVNQASFQKLFETKP